jgi:FkbM family methyltransferase
MRTKLEVWLRNRARRAIDGLFCSRSPDVRRIGDIDSGWVIQVHPLPSVSYCAGVGKGMSFETELAKLTGGRVLVFDPSPTGIATVERSDAAPLTFYRVGLAAQLGTCEFSLPADPDEGSYSVPREGIGTVRFECWDLETIMRMHSHTSIDLLKMDIEGFEYDIIDRLIERKIPVRQICVEFHPWLRPGRTLKTIRKLYSARYRIVHKHRGDHTFVLRQSRTSATDGCDAPRE